MRSYVYLERIPFYSNVVFYGNVPFIGKRCKDAERQSSKTVGKRCEKIARQYKEVERRYKDGQNYNVERPLHDKKTLTFY